jgi:antitoxin VapB
MMSRKSGTQPGEAAAPPLSLNIKNPETCRLIQELANLTGETMTAAVTIAVRERLDRLREEQKGDLAERLLAIGRECAKLLGEDFRKLDYNDMLYDEKGLPR